MVNRDFVGALLQLNAEKHVPREQLVRTVEDAIQSAYRRVGGDEDIHVRIDADSGKIRVFRARRVVDEVEDPLDRVHRRRGPGHSTPTPQLGDLVETEELDRTTLRPHPRPDRQAGRAAAAARGRARRGLRPVREPRGRDHHRHGQPRRAAGVILDVGKAWRRSWPPPSRAPVEHYRIGQHVKAYVLEVRRTTRGPADLRQPHPQELPAPAVRARGARDPRRHGRDQGDRPRGRQPHQGRGRQPPGGPRPGRRDRRPARRARPGRRRRARRREDRRHPVERGPGRVRRQRAEPGAGRQRRHRRGAPHRDRDRARADALAGHRPRGPERPPGGQADRLAHRHPQRRLGRRGGARAAAPTPAVRRCRGRRSGCRSPGRRRRSAHGSPRPTRPRRPARRRSPGARC